jgi:hypothetical protein
MVTIDVWGTTCGLTRTDKAKGPGIAGALYVSDRATGA